MNRVMLILSPALFFIGLTIGFFLENHAVETEVVAEDKPLYWVAPMDSNYRRDKPGKSPMGMDLIPVYEEEETAEEGIVRIAPAVENNIGVRTAPVNVGAFHEEISTVGYIGFDEEKLWHVHSRVDGWIDKLFIKTEGEIVQKGDVLFSFYSPTLVNAQEEFLSTLARGGNKRIIASSRDRLKALGLTREQIRLIEKTRKTEQYVKVYARKGGYVSRLKVREGQYIKPESEVMSVGPIDTVWVIAEVFERQAAWLSAGLKAEMALDYLPGKTWPGNVDYIYPILDPATRTMRVRIRFDNADETLKPNMFAQVTIFGETQNDVLSIPREALIDTGKQERVVLSLGEGRFQPVEVVSGRESDGFIEIRQGLRADEVVVTSAHFLLDSESNVTAGLSRLSPLRGSGMEMVEVTGIVVAQNHEQHAITINHEPVAKWQWPAMTMDFDLSEEVLLSQVSPGDEVQFTLCRQSDGSMFIMELMKTSKPVDSDNEMNHGNMDHSKMNHKNMDHEKMDHSKMDHGEMDDNKMKHKEMDHENMHHDHRDMEMTP